MTRVHASKKALAGVAAAVMLGAMAFSTAPAFADDAVDGPDDVTINLTVPATGALTMTVDNSPVTLTENGSDAANRKFTGTLGTVTVTDTRSDAPSGVGWAVVGVADDFVDSTDANKTIGAEYLGWAPELLTPPTNPDSVAAGSDVDSSALGGDGLVSGVDMLAFSIDSAESQAESGTSSSGTGTTSTGATSTNPESTGTTATGSTSSGGGGEGSTGPEVSSSDGSGGGSLPNTGTTVMRLVLPAGLLLLAGGLILSLVRRRGSGSGRHLQS